MVGGAHDQPVPVIPVTVMPAGMFSVMVMAPAGNVIGGPALVTHTLNQVPEPPAGVFSLPICKSIDDTQSPPSCTVPSGHVHGPGTSGAGQICGTHFPSCSTVPCGHTQVWVTGSRTSGGTHSVSYTHLRAHETDSYLVCR